MRSTRRRSRSILTGLRTGTALAAIAATAVAMTAPAHATTGAGATKAQRSSHSHLNAQAKQAGLDPTKGARMGWANPQTSATPMTATAKATLSAGSVYGIDVSAYQGNVDWAHWWGQGKRFAYIKATEGTYSTNTKFTQQYNGSYKVGMIRGSYHFANPKSSSGATQATYFVKHGGGWSKDGKTLPGALDIEYNPYSGGTCYGKTHSGMVSWIKSFTTQYKKLTGRYAVIYSTADWWSTCTGNSTAFRTTSPLWLARYSSSPGTIPGGWGFYTIWQYASSPLDSDRFNGSLDRLKALANG